MYLSNFQKNDSVLIIPIINSKFKETELLHYLNIGEKKIRILTINGSNTHKLHPELNFFLKNVLQENGILKINERLFLAKECHYIITLDPVATEDLEYLELSLRLVFYPPTYVGNVITFIINGGAAYHHSDFFSLSGYSTRNYLNFQNISKSISIFYLINSIEKDKIKYLESLLEIAKINNIYFQTGLLWNFIEGYWKVPNKKNNIHKSFKQMMSSASKEFENDKFREIKKVIENNNLQFGKDKVSSIRNFILHGNYLTTNDISKTQKNIIILQRDLLFELIVKSILNS